MVANSSRRGLATAARALVVLVRAERGMATSAEVAELIGSHPVVVRRLLGGLRWSGLVESRSGPTGGWAVAKDPATIRLGDVYRAVSSETPAAATTPLDAFLEVAEQAYLAHLDDMTLAELAKGDALPTDS
jgi:DNA-binding IscR family transcriptional regulator